MTLTELAIVLAIGSVMIAMATPSLGRMIARQRGRDAAQLVSAALTLARSEAIRTGRNHVVFFQTDAQGNPLQDANGDPASIVILDDGPPGSLGQNCRIDAGEDIQALNFTNTVVPGVLGAEPKVPSDLGNGALIGLSSFEDPAGNPAQWVLFRPEGMPLAFDAACNVGATGSGAGGIYLNTGQTSYAAVLLPLGATRVHGWDGDGNQWSN